MTDPTNKKPLARPLSPPESVPLFNCHAYLSGPDEHGRYGCRCANLDGIEAHGDSPRAALQQVVTEFKSTVQAAHSQGESIPWIDPPRPIQEGEQIQLIPIHL